MNIAIAVVYLGVVSSHIDVVRDDDRGNTSRGLGKSSFPYFSILSHPGITHGISLICQVRNSAKKGNPF